MKKILITCFYLLMTAVISASGFLLPSVMSAYQDKQIFAKIEHTSMEPLELTYSSSLYDTLRLLSEGHYYVDYPLTGSSRTADEVYEIVLKLIGQFEDYGIILSDSEYTVTNHTITLQLAIASDNNRYTDAFGLSQEESFPASAPETDAEDAADSSPDITTAVVWACSVYFVSGYWMNFWIDDKSGKAVAFSMYTGQSLLLPDSMNTSSLDKFIGRLTDFLQDYYELPAAALYMPVVHSSNPLFDKNLAAAEADYSIQLKEDSGRLIQMPLRIRPEYMVLN